MTTRRGVAEICCGGGGGDENRRTTKWVSGPTRSEVWTRRRWSGCARCGIRVAMVARDSELEPARVEKQRRGLGRLRKAMTCVSQREKRQDSKPKASDSRKAPRGGTATRAIGSRAKRKDGDRARVHTSKFADGLVARSMCGRQERRAGGGCRSEPRELENGANLRMQLSHWSTQRGSRWRLITHPSRTSRNASVLSVQRCNSAPTSPIEKGGRDIA